MLPTVDFCGTPMSRLVLGANPFAGFSHQSEARDRAMRAFHTRDRILETWDRAARAGVTAFVTNTETPHVVEAVQEYLKRDGCMRWIAQMNGSGLPMPETIDRVAAMGAAAGYVHGGVVDELYVKKDEKTLRGWVERARERKLVIGAAAHNPDAHRWVNGLNLVDFHAVPFFNCGSVHSRGGGEDFVLDDVFRAVELIRSLEKPCIAYKVLGAGRLDARMGLDFAFRHIKPGDVVNLGVSRLDNDDMVEDDVRIVEELLCRPGDATV